MTGYAAAVDQRDRQDWFRQVFRLLRPGGRFSIAEPIWKMQPIWGGSDHPART